MPKIQGKQIADKTIDQANILLTTPTITDTLSAVTVEYVTTAISAVTSTSGILGIPTDGSYSDGIFTDWTSGTTVANMADAVNEMLLLLAPSPPLTSWDNVFSNLNIGGTLYESMKIAGGTTTTTSSITTNTTPDISVSVISLTGSAARSRDGGIFTLSDTVHSTIETVTLTTSSVTKSSGWIRYTIADPYYGIAGQAGFWTGVTAFSLTDSTSAFTPSATLRTLTFAHPGTDTPETKSFYVDEVASTVVVTTNSETMPTMSSYISGIPTLSYGQSITNVDFDIAGAVKWFYNPTIWKINGSYVVDTGWSVPTGVPAANVTYNETGASVNIANNVFNDNSFSYTLNGRNIQGTSDTDVVTKSTYRIDTKSVETSRKLSGTGPFPTTALSNYYYGTWVSSSDLTTGDWVRELMMKEGKYQWPGSIDYSAYGGPNYLSVTGGDTHVDSLNYRWACFSVGSVSNDTNFTFTINGVENFGSTNIITGIKLYVRVVGATGTAWLDANAAWGGATGDSDGDAMLVFGESTVTTRKVTFGSVRTGTVYVRIGLQSGSTKKFTSIS